MSATVHTLRLTLLATLWCTFSAAAVAQERLVDAVKANDAVTVRALLDKRVDVNAVQADGTTALHWAADA